MSQYAIQCDALYHCGIQYRPARNKRSSARQAVTRAGRLLAAMICSIIASIAGSATPARFCEPGCAAAARQGGRGGAGARGEEEEGGEHHGGGGGGEGAAGAKKKKKKKSLPRFS